MKPPDYRSVDILNSFKLALDNIEYSKKLFAVVCAILCSLLVSFEIVLLLFASINSVTTATSLFFLGSCFGAILNFVVCDSIGRQHALLYVLLMFSVILVWLLLAPFTYSIAHNRFLSGYCVGMIECILPVYIAGK